VVSGFVALVLFLTVAYHSNSFFRKMFEEVEIEWKNSLREILGDEQVDNM
jgi:hypothetical protein